jgi:S1-C subfamily serine protease
VVKIVCEDDDNYYTGSGTNFDASGYVLTNLHVVEGADQCAVGFVDAKSGLIKELYWATPIIDKENITGHDLAYLSIEEPIFDDELNIYGYFDKFSNSQFPYFKIKKECESKEIQLGDQIFVIGYPYLSGGALTITNGLVSSLYSEDGYIITSAKINPGNSGGLAIDYTGCYIGVPSAVYYEDGEESFGEIIDPEFVAEFDEAIADDLDIYINNL